MRFRTTLLTLLAAGFLASAGQAPAASPGNRLTYLDDDSPYYPDLTFPKLTTPQWVGEDGVEAVVILGIDDMRGHARWEEFLRPILARLKKIDGRAPVSIMTCSIDPKEPHLQTWLKEGLSLETHTVDHPCPVLRNNDFKEAKSTYDRCVDLLASVPGNQPVAFRTPCCDSLNTVSPRFYSGIFNSTTAKANFLRADSSVFNLFTADDPELPRDLVLEADGRERFRKYLPRDRAFVNTIENYPYPYVINRLCWQFPCATPSDWQGQHRHGPNNPATLRDWKATLDATVAKKGVCCLVFHPHGWIRAAQVVDFIDHVVAAHGKKVKFLTFKEAVARLEKNVLGEHSLRAANGQDNGVRLIDLDNDGFLDVVVGNDKDKQTRRWVPVTRTWEKTSFPVPIIEKGKDAGLRFGIMRKDGFTSFLCRAGDEATGYHFDGKRWVEDRTLAAGLSLETPATSSILLRDLDRDGTCELIYTFDRPVRGDVYSWSAEKSRWQKLPFRLPGSEKWSPAADVGLRFVDVDEDGFDDVLISNNTTSSLHRFVSMEKGWQPIFDVRPGTPKAIPAIARDGVGMGFWVHSRSLWWQNETTARLKDLVDRRSFNDLLPSIDPGPKSPEASLRALKPAPGFVAQLVACEPVVQSPIAFAWGPDGRFWVVEMGDYPLGVDGKGKPGGRVKILSEPDASGKYTKGTIFLDKLPFPTGVMPWRKGVLITCAPDILYAEDTKGDGKADKIEWLYRGFREGNQQHRVNGLSWGLDNWVYCANGDSGGRVAARKTKKVIDISGRDLRLRPDEGDHEAVTGQTQYGRSRDDHGNWFGGNNSNPLWHFVLEDRYLARNSHLAVSDVRVSVPSVPGAAPVFPISRTLPRFNDPGGANRFTSACSPIIYRDELFGPAFRNNTFVSEPVHNLVHREVMRPQGSTFRSTRHPDEERSEFLASSDNWFRPTMILTGPDGSLWVADMYRAVIEHPEWIPKEIQKTIDLRAGHDKGRIYRIYPVGAKPRAIPRLAKLDGPGLVAALDSPSGWQRDLAQMMLLWRADKEVVPALEKLMTSTRPLARLHALCTLDGLKALTPVVLIKALADEDAAVRRHAVRLCEGRVQGSRELGTALLKRSDDTDPFVQMQLAYTLGEWTDPRAAKALGWMATRAGGDRFRTTAILSSLNKDNLDGVLEAVLSAGSPIPEVLDGVLKTASGLKHDKALVTALRVLGKAEKGNYADWQLDGLGALLEGLSRRGSSLDHIAREGGKETREVVEGVRPLFDLARRRIGDGKETIPVRIQAVRLLGRGPGVEKDRAALAGLLDVRTPVELQLAAIDALAALGGEDVPKRLLVGWRGHGPQQRRRILAVLLERTAWLEAVLKTVEKKEIQPVEIDLIQRRWLLEHPDRRVREQAAKVLALTIDTDRQKVIDSYLPALKLPGDRERGKKVFATNCAFCHKMGDLGQEVGPDLATVAGRPGEYLLEAIFAPNRAVEARYVVYVAELKDGRVVTGLLHSETATSITMIDARGMRLLILRANLEELVSSRQSMMPEGLERTLKHQDVADLLAWLRGTRKARSFPGNNPEVVRAGADGTLGLLASNAEIFGSSLVFEAKYGNLGYWSHSEDEAVWQVRVGKAGTYGVWLEWACEPSSAGNAFVVEAGKAKLTHKVASTGSWDVYKKARIGTLKLEEGLNRVHMRSAGPIRGSLIDLKGLRLAPEEKKE